ncbi:MAG: NUDIX hydrolase [Candidatus Delongbacteria bacterium]|nr:NUDIX hydrolase [Candidatus Delongbacteria bacterium]
MRIRVSGVFEQDNEILTMKYVYGGKEVLALPGGGVERDIPILEALQDEWKEELGVKVVPGNIIQIGEAHPDKRHPQTLHIIFQINEIHGTPRIQHESTHSLELVWLPVNQVSQKPLYPDVGKNLQEHFMKQPRESVPFIQNCMERGYW